MRNPSTESPNSCVSFLTPAQRWRHLHVAQDAGWQGHGATGTRDSGDTAQQGHRMVEMQDGGDTAQQGHRTAATRCNRDTGQWGHRMAGTRRKGMQDGGDTAQWGHSQQHALPRPTARCHRLQHIGPAASATEAGLCQSRPLHNPFT